MTSSEKRRLRDALKGRLLSLLNDSRRVETQPSDSGQDIMRFRYERGYIADHMVEAAWDLIAEPFLQAASNSRGGFTALNYDRPQDMQMVLVQIGDLSFIGELHPDCGDDWFMLDGTRVDGGNSWWMPIPLLPA